MSLAERATEVSVIAELLARQQERVRLVRLRLGVMERIEAGLLRRYRELMEPEQVLPSDHYNG